MCYGMSDVKNTLLLLQQLRHYIAYSGSDKYFPICELYKSSITHFYRDTLHFTTITHTM
jgi:hypothetical protein